MSFKYEKLSIMKNFLILFVITGFTIYNLNAQTPATEAINFIETDIHGNEINLFEILDNGQHVLIDFFFVACVPCQAVSPIVNQSYLDFGCNSFDIFHMSISGKIEDSNADCIEYDETYGVEYPTLSGNEGGGSGIASKYQITSYPTVILIAPNHDIIEQHIWPIEDVDDVNTPILNAGCEFNECETGTQENIYPFVKVYPNPANGPFYIEFKKPGEANIQLINLFGNIILEKNITVNNSHFIKKIDPGSLSKGINFLKINFNDKICVLKINNQ